MTPKALDIECVGCGDVFTFDTGQQEFFAQRGFDPPKRCQPCRRHLRELRGDRPTTTDPHELFRTPFRVE